MKLIHPFYIIGSLAFACTGLLHIAVALATVDASLGIWLPMYIVWLGFMCVGLPLTLRGKARASESGGT